MSRISKKPFEVKARRKSLTMGSQNILISTLKPRKIWFDDYGRGFKNSLRIESSLIYSKEISWRLLIS